MKNTRFTIPNTFKLLGQTYKVEYNNDKCDGASAYGLASFSENTIYLATEVNNKPIAQDAIEHTFFHELTHMILHSMGKEKLNADEKFVDLFGGMLHQVATTMMYKEEQTKMDWSKVEMMPRNPPKIEGDRPVG